MENIVSKIDGGCLACVFHGGLLHTGDFEHTAPEEILQVGVRRLDGEQSFRSHAHLRTIRETEGTAEAWLVLNGLVRAFVFDLDDRLVTSLELRPGDCLITLRGGHSLETLTPATIYEFKNGPYLGQEKDKRFLP